MLDLSLLGSCFWRREMVYALRSPLANRGCLYPTSFSTRYRLRLILATSVATLCEQSDCWSESQLVCAYCKFWPYLCFCFQFALYELCGNILTFYLKALALASFLDDFTRAPQDQIPPFLRAGSHTFLSLFMVYILGVKLFSMVFFSCFWNHGLKSLAP